jgi:translation initiation factor IF-2
MSDNNDQGNSGGRKPLTVVRKTSGTVKQSFSHGRSKQVVVETKKRRPVTAGGAPGSGQEAEAATPASVSMEAKLVALAQKLGITVDELKARQKVLEQRKSEENARAKELEATKASQDRLRTEQERKASEGRERDEAEARRKAEEEARKAAEAAPRETVVDRPVKVRPRAETASPAAAVPVEDDDAGRGKRGGKVVKDDRAGDRAREAAARSRDTGARRQGKLTIASALGDDADRQRSLASVRRARERERERKMGGGDNREKVSIEVTLPESITLQDLAGRMRARCCAATTSSMPTLQNSSRPNSATP